MRKMAAQVSLAVSCLLAGMVGLTTSHVSLAEKIGKVTQPLVAGTLVSAQEQQDQGLVSLSSRAGSCSASLLNSEWVISAAHCFQDPNVMAGEVSVTANWSTKQKKNGKELYILEKDMAILRVDSPFAGVAVDYNMPVFTGALQPGKTVKVYGRGIYQLATKDTPSKGDGKYRSGEFDVSRIDDMHFWFGPGKGGAIPAGGDSGGPAFVNAGGRWFLAGISSECSTGTVAGKPSEGWDWVEAIDECGYAPVGAVWNQLQARIGSPACRNYAWRAVGAVELTKYYNCDPKVVSGPRWTPNFDDHLNFCIHAKAAEANFEDKERNRITQECRIAAAMPQGTSALKVAQSGDSFALSGSGYAVNSRVIIRVFGPAAIHKNITSNFADASGNFAATVNSADVCAQAGSITFTAEDQDKPASAPVNATCQTVAATPAPPPPPPPGNETPAPPPPPPPGEKFVTVKLSVDLYDAPGGKGQAIGTLEAGTAKVTLVEPCNDSWCHVKWPAGLGWVYSGPDYQSLQLP